MQIRVMSEGSMTDLHCSTLQALFTDGIDGTEHTPLTKSASSLRKAYLDSIFIESS